MRGQVLKGHLDLLLPALYLPTDIWLVAGGIPLVLILIMSVLVILRPERFSGGTVATKGSRCHPDFVTVANPSGTPTTVFVTSVAPR